MTEQAIGVGMIGCGTVGGGVAALLRDHAALYARRAGRPIQLRRVLVRNPHGAVRDAGVDPNLVTDDPDAFFATENMPIVIEVAGGLEPIAGYVRRALEAGRHVITANKALLAAEGTRLFELARANNACIAFEASCAGGIPCVTALKFGLMANEIHGLYGILNGTCNFILTAMTQQGRDYHDVLAEAQRIGYAEADPTLDVSGRDAGQKLAILASLAFDCEVTENQFSMRGVDQLSLDDIRFGLELDYDIKLLAIAERRTGEDGISLSVEPCFIHDNELLAKVQGAYNALSVYGDAVGHTLYYGAGAGRMPTASAVVSDLLNVAAGWYPQAFSRMKLTPDCNGRATILAPEQQQSRYYLRINGLDVPGTMAQITRLLGDAGISLSAVHQHEAKEGEFVPIVVLTHEATRGHLEQAIAEIKSLSVVEGEPVLLRIVDMPL